MEDLLDKFLLDVVMWEMGILPLDFEESDVGRRLAQLPPDEALKAKRRFRKEWRKIARQGKKCKIYGLGEEHPDRNSKKMRKYAVLYECLRLVKEKKENLWCKTERD